jgi:DNA-binding NarL/FixJ family response regulator
MSIVEDIKLKVAIVDDSDIIRERLVQRIIKCSSMEVVWYSENVENTYKCCGEKEPEVLILDIQLPDGSGIDILEKIKLERKDVKVIMLTNYPSLPFRKKCIAAGADYFFDKSTEFEKVFEVLKEMAHGCIKN